jgi:hypothetical protein
MNWGHRIGELEQRLRRLELVPKVVHLKGGGAGASVDEEFSWISTDQVARTVSIRGGVICSGINDPIVVPDATVRITGGTEGAPSFVYVKWQWGALTAEIPETAVTTRPVSGDDFFRRAIEAFYIRGGQIVRARRPRAIHIENVAP